MTPLFSDIKLLRRIEERMLEASITIRDGKTIFVVEMSAAEHGITRLQINELVEKMMSETT